MPHDLTLSVMAGGPSLARTWQQAEGRLIAVNGVHDWLVDRGTIPWACCLLDADPRMADLVTPRDDVIYFVASMSDPAVFDRMKGRHVVLWHASGPAGAELALARSAYMAVGGGTTVAVRCLTLGYVLGFRRFRFFGLDSSYEDGVSHAYQHDLLPTVTVAAGNREFVTQVGFAKQALDFCEIMDNFESGMLTGKPEHLDVEVIGDGLLPTLIAEHRKELANA